MKKKEVGDLIRQKYGDYLKVGEDKYLSFVYNLMETDPGKAREIHESLRRADAPTPPNWFDFIKHSKNWHQF